MGTLPKTFGFENVSIPFCTGKDNWRAIGEKDGPVVLIHHNSKKWLDTTNYELAITNFWMAGSRIDEIPSDLVKNANRVSVHVSSTRDRPAIPAVADRHDVNWMCPFKRYIGASLQRDIRKVSRKKGLQRIAQPDNGENLLADRPSTRSAWQRHPSWLVKFDANEVEDGKRIYRLFQCERNGGIQNVITDAFLRHGNGTYRLSFEVRVMCDSPVPLEMYAISNEKRKILKTRISNGGTWHVVSEEIVMDFDLGVTDLMSILLRAVAPCDELCFRNLSFVKIR
jgi:hypothetical protein